MAANSPLNRYTQIILFVFMAKWMEGALEVEFTRDDLAAAVDELGIEAPKNLGDVIYAFRYRQSLPEEIRGKAPSGQEWIIQGVGSAAYKFRAVGQPLILPSQGYAEIRIPDATPGMIDLYRQGDEQALLAKLRYNRLIDVFLGITCYSLQNHFRTTVDGIGQIEIDELYVGLDKRGAHFVIPVQAKGGKDHISIVQIDQDFQLCKDPKFAHLHPLPVAAQFVADDLIALFAFAEQDGLPVVVSERHYRLVPSYDVSPEDLRQNALAPEV